ncbi:MAG: 1-acyl-sn-glycerol-3-phosphate acyltransferase [Verrucomicrobia bacterium]|nr:MAG: 1-acyl-sn-glycerol-3-phosphate acyltransferase [Verrucomicrobiota bacterium]
MSSMSFTYYFWYTLSKIVARFFFSFKVIHPERMLEEGPLILASNHQSYFDPPLVGICSRRGVYYLARKTLLQIPLLGKLLPQINVILVDRDGNDMSALKSVIRTVKSGNGVVLFPEGTRSVDGSLQPGKAGIGLVIAKTRAPVQPVRIFGSYEAFPKGSDKISLTPITVVVGKPLRFTDADLDPDPHRGDERALYQYLSDRVMAAIAELQLPEKF